LGASSLCPLTQAKGHPESSFNDENLRMVVADLFTAGMVTTSTTLAWALLLMTLHPDVQRELRRGGLGGRGGQVAPGPWLCGTQMTPNSVFAQVP
jgi:cytochrome P450